MAVSFKHNKTVTKSDGVDSTVVQPSDWNAEHLITAAAGKVLGTVTGATSVSELPIEVDAAGQSVKLPSGTAVSRPLSPSSGMVRYNSTSSRLEYYTNGAWKNVDNMTVGVSPPASPLTGDVFVETDANDALTVYTGAGFVSPQTTPVDGSVTMAKLATALQGMLAPTSAVLPFAGTSEPTGWLFCFGQAVSRTTYATLFGAIGTTYGVGDNATTFNLPDLRGRVVAGQDDMGGTSANRLTGATGGVDGDVLGGTGGLETHTLTTAQLPAHQHFVSNGVDSTGSLSNTNYVNGQANPGTNNDYTLTGGATVADRGLTSSTGSGAAHNIVQPTIILNYIIKI